MEHYGSDFNATGSVMSRAELEDQRRKRGECVRCGQKCFQKKLFKMIPITEHGKVDNGRCLNCNPLDASAGAVPAVSRPATQADLKRFSRSQNVLRSQSTHINPNPNPVRPSQNGGMEQRRTASQSTMAESIQSSRSIPDSFNSNRQYNRRRSATPGGGGRSQRSLASGHRNNGLRTSDASIAGFSDTYIRGDRSMDGDASVVSSCSSTRAHGLHTTGRSTESLQSAPMNDNSPHFDSRGMDSGILPIPGASRPGFNRPNSNRSISASSYYSSRRSDTPPPRNVRQHSPEDEEQESEYARGFYRDENHEMNGDYTREGYIYEEQYEYEGVEKAPAREYVDRNNLDYYHRSTHESVRSMSDDDSRHDANLENFAEEDGTPPGSAHVNNRSNGGGSLDGSSYHFRPSFHRRDQTLRNSTYRSLSPDAYSSNEFRERQRPNMENSASSFAEESRQILEHALSDSKIGEQKDGTGNWDSSNEPIVKSTSAKDMQALTSSEDGPPLAAAADFPILQQLRDAGSNYVEILNVMRDYQDLAHVQSLGMQILSNLQLTDDDCNSMANLGVIQIITEAMMAYNDVLDLQISGCRAIWNTSFTPVNQLAFVDCGALDVLLKSMLSFPMEADFQEQALSVMANLGAAEQNLETIVEKGGVEGIVNAMNKHISRISVQVRGCLAVANLASHHSPLKQKILEQGAGSAIVISMVMHPICTELQEKGLRALRNLSANCDQNRVELTNIGGIDAIVSAMQVHRDAEGVQEAGAWTLSNLAGNPDSRVLIGDCGGIDVTIRAMWVHSDKVAVQEWCCRALFTLSIEQHNRALILEVGGISAIVNAMQAHNDSSPIQEMGCAVLLNLGFDQPSKMRIVDEEALDAVVLAMVLHGEDDKVQERACQLLLQLSIAENFKAMQASNVGELVKNAAEKFPVVCGEPANRLLTIIDGYISEYL